MGPLFTEREKDSLTLPFFLPHDEIALGSGKPPAGRTAQQRSPAGGTWVRLNPGPARASL